MGSPELIGKMANDKPADFKQNSNDTFASLGSSPWSQWTLGCHLILDKPEAWTFHQGPRTEWGGIELSGSVYAQPVQDSDSILSIQQNKTFSSMPRRNAIWLLTQKRRFVNAFPFHEAMSAPWVDFRVRARSGSYKVRPGSCSSPASRPCVQDPVVPIPLVSSPWPRPWMSRSPETQIHLFSPSFGRYLWWLFLVVDLTTSRINYKPKQLCTPVRDF